MICFREKSQNGNTCLGNDLGKCTLGFGVDFGCDLYCAEYDCLGKSCRVSRIRDHKAKLHKSVKEVSKIENQD